MKLFVLFGRTWFCSSGDFGFLTLLKDVLGLYVLLFLVFLSNCKLLCFKSNCNYLMLFGARAICLYAFMQILAICIVHMQRHSWFV